VGELCVGGLRTSSSRERDRRRERAPFRARRLIVAERILSDRLADCGIDPDRIPSVVERLTRPSFSFAQTALDDPAIFSQRFSGGAEIYPDTTTGVWEAKPREFDGDMAARTLRLNEGRPDPAATWKSLSRAERKAARRLWGWTAKPHGLSVTPQGRPPAIDPALVLYLIRVLCEATGKCEFEFLRNSGRLGGPMLQALVVAFPLAQQFLAMRFGMPAIGRISTKRSDRRGFGTVEAIAEIARVTRSKSFKDLCETLRLGTTADDVAWSPAYARRVIAIARSRKSRSRE
jgi:hypothetical protein